MVSSLLLCMRTRQRHLRRFPRDLAKLKVTNPSISKLLPQLEGSFRISRQEGAKSGRKLTAATLAAAAAAPTADVSRNLRHEQGE